MKRHLLKRIANCGKWLARKTLNEDQLSAFQWYRREQGGYWTRCNALGWRTLPDRSANMDLDFSRKAPELYRNGQDVEDYRKGDDLSEL